jgi:Ca2+-binding RTX toxin-like protein
MFNFGGISGTQINLDWLTRYSYGSENNDVFERPVSSYFIQKYYGYGGNDTFMSSTGQDIYYGGAGIDTVNYSNSNAGVTVNFSTGYGSGGHAQGDRYNRVENIKGSEYADKLTGNNSDNKFKAGAGNDTLNGMGGNDKLYGEGGNDTFISGAGADTYYGGADTDTVDYSGSSSGVSANLTTGNGSRGDAEGDRYSRIENIRGSDQSDNLHGNWADNVIKGGDGFDELYGRDGNDRLFGEGGSDTLHGGIGDDELYGGVGSDRFYLEVGRDDYFGGADGDVLLAIGHSDFTIDLEAGRGYGGLAEGDTYSSIESVVFDSVANINAIGSANDERFSFGSDSSENISIDAAGGNDTLAVSINGRTAFDQHANSSFNGGNGNDTILLESNLDLVVDLNDGEIYEQNNDDDAIGFDNFENVMSGSGDDRIIDQRGDNNVMTGGAGNDTFRFNHQDDDGFDEQDTITDFSAGEDRIDLRNTEIDSWQNLINASDGQGMFNSGNDVVIQTTDRNNDTQFDTILLEGVTVAELEASDFIFG